MMAKKKTEMNLDELLENALVKESKQPYEVPGNWVWVKLEELFDITSSKRVFKTEWKSSGIPFYRAREIAELSVKDKIDNELFISKEMYEDYSKKYGVPNAGDILITAVGTLGKVYIVKTNDKFYFKDGNVIWLKKKNTLLKSSIIKYFFESFFMLKKIQDISTGTVVKTYTITKAKETLFPLPPFPEQKRIVKKLSSMLGKLKEARELIKEAKDTFEERRAAILNKAFTGELTKKWREENPDVELELPKIQEIEKKPFDIPSSWKWARLQDVCSRFQYGTSAKSSKEGKVPVVRMGNIQNGIISWENLVYTSKDKEIDQYSLNYNDVLFNRTNSPALVGKTAIYKGEMPAIYAGYLIRVKPQDKLNADFLNFFLNSPYARYKCNRVKTDGVSQSNINSKKLGNFEVPLPPLEEQKETVRILEKLLDHEDGARALIDMEEQIDLIEKSILSKAFRGELGTNDPDDEPAIELLKRSLKEKAKAPEKPKAKNAKAKSV